MRPNTCNTILVALDGVIQLGNVPKLAGTYRNLLQLKPVANFILAYSIVSLKITIFGTLNKWVINTTVRLSQ